VLWHTLWRYASKTPRRWYVDGIIHTNTIRECLPDNQQDEAVEVAIRFYG
jgi:hypothetical protein